MKEGAALRVEARDARDVMSTRGNRWYGGLRPMSIFGQYIVHYPAFISIITVFNVSGSLAVTFDFWVLIARYIYYIICVEYIMSNLDRFLVSYTQLCRRE